MLYSMTGFGRAEGAAGGRPVTVEIRSLNGKGLELSPRISPLLRPWEGELRSLAGARLIRGSVDLSVTVRQDGSAKPMAVNADLAVAYYKAMQDISARLGAPEEPLMATLMRMPEVVTPAADILPESDWGELLPVLNEALDRITEHRRTEGAAIEADLLGRIAAIEGLLEEVLPLEAARSERLRTKLQHAFRESGIEGIDSNRFEQELIYYFEKMDFSEEKTRLRQHCDYFRVTVAGEETAKGKLLGFILQEVGREVNTLGSKAQDAGIQRIVVQMKDELEKAKEQVLNVL